MSGLPATKPTAWPAVLLHVANGMAQFVSRGFPGENALWKITPEKLPAAGLKEENFESAIATTESSFDAAVAALSRCNPDTAAGLS